MKDGYDGQANVSFSGPNQVLRVAEYILFQGRSERLVLARLVTPQRTGIPWQQNSEKSSTEIQKRIFYV